MNHSSIINGLVVCFENFVIKFCFNFLSNFVDGQDFYGRSKICESTMVQCCCTYNAVMARFIIHRISYIMHERKKVPIELLEFCKKNWTDSNIFKACTTCYLLRYCKLNCPISNTYLGVFMQYYISS